MVCTYGAGWSISRECVVLGEVSVIAGSESVGFVEGKGTTARFAFPSDVAVDDGNIIVCDRNNHRIRMIYPDGYAVVDWDII